jgi:hypothetical protein
MALAYLLSPTFEIVNTSGKPATGGYIEVYVAGSRDPYYCYSNWEGVLHPFRIPLDSLGSNVVLADSAGAYDVYVYNRYGTLLMSRYNVKPGAGGGSGGGVITSSDGSIEVTQTAAGYDLKVNGQDASVLRASASDLVEDGQFVFSELVRDGDQIYVDNNGKVRLEDGWYHYDVTARVKWEDATLENTETHVQLYTTLNSDLIPFDLSYEHENTMHLHGEVKNTTGGSQFTVGVQGIPSGMVVELVDFGIFAIIGHGSAAEYEAGTGIVIDDHEISIDPDYVQEKLTAGTGIIIDDNEVSVDTDVIQEKLTAGSNIVIEGSTISATAEPQQQADWAEADSSAVDYIKNKPTIKPVVAGSNITITEGANNVTISSQSDPQVQSDWTEADSSAVDYIKNKPTIKPVVAGSNITITEANDSVTISSQSDPQVQADWAEADSSAVDYIKNKPQNLVQDASYVHTDNNFTDADKSKLTGIESGAQVNVQSDWTEADTSSDAYIQHKPVEKTLVAGDNIAITTTSNTVTISATVPAQVQADWAEADSSAVDFIQNKPNLALKEDVANKKQSIDATSTTDYASSKAVADFVNSSVSTATANFLGNYTLTELGLTYPATTSQIETALDGYTFSTTPTNNDYVYVEVQNPQTTGIDDEVQRYKFNGTSWLYEYTLNNSSFTATEKAAIDSGITATDVGNYDAHIADTDIHVTTSDKSTWNGKQDAISDLNTIRTGAGLGATAVQPGDLATVATTGSYNDLLDLPTIPTVPVQDVQVDGVSVVSNGVAEITMPAESTVVAGSNITITEANSTITIAATVPVIGTITL